MAEPVTLIFGVGPGNGMAFARRFASGGHRVALAARDGARMEAAAAEIPGARGYACDVGDGAAVAETVASASRDLGAPTALVYNAGSGAWGTADQITPEDLQRNMDINATGLLRAAQAVLPGMRAAGGGTILVVGAGAALRGRAGTIAFAAGKAAQRSVAQSLARHLGPEGIHVAYLVIDGVIDIPATRTRMPDAPEEVFLQPAAIAEAGWMLAHQDRSAWTFELDLRPHVEKW